MIRLTKHYKKRYKERISKSSKNMRTMAEKAFEFGIDLDKIENYKIKKELERKSMVPWVYCKIYRGYVWWFSATSILTVYALPIIRSARNY